MKQERIVMLAGKGESTNIVYNALKEEFNIEKVIIEEPVSKILFIKRRMKKLGFIKVSGQILFQLLVYPILKNNSKGRIREILENNNLSSYEINNSKIKNVSSVNTDEVISILKEMEPTIVLVNGTRIISRKVLESISVPFVNIHVGITPMYRGVHGAYWALIEEDLDHCGVTVHYVDSGIDTGNILEQGLITVTKEDNFSTYPFLQLAAGIPLLKNSLTSLINGMINFKESPKGKTRLRTHPSIFEYLYFRVSKGVR